MSWQEWGPDGFDYPEWAYEPVDYCDRCHAVMTDGQGTQAIVSFPDAGVGEWFWCDDCADAFTAWRLTPDPPLDDAGGEVPPLRVIEEGP